VLTVVSATALVKKTVIVRTFPLLMSAARSYALACIPQAHLPGHVRSTSFTGAHPLLDLVPQAIGPPARFALPFRLVSHSIRTPVRLLSAISLSASLILSRIDRQTDACASPRRMHLIEASLSQDLRTASTASPRFAVAALSSSRAVPRSPSCCSLHSPRETGFSHTERAESGT
jgi:hypothetical protein